MGSKNSSNSKETNTYRNTKGSFAINNDCEDTDVDTYFPETSQSVKLPRSTVAYKNHNNFRTTITPDIEKNEFQGGNAFKIRENTLVQLTDQSNEDNNTNKSTFVTVSNREKFQTIDEYCPEKDNQKQSIQPVQPMQRDQVSHSICFKNLKSSNLSNSFQYNNFRSTVLTHNESSPFSSSSAYNGHNNENKSNIPSIRSSVNDLLSKVNQVSKKIKAEQEILRKMTSESIEEEVSIEPILDNYSEISDGVKKGAYLVKGRKSKKVKQNPQSMTNLRKSLLKNQDGNNESTIIQGINVQINDKKLGEILSNRINNDDIVSSSLSIEFNTGLDGSKGSRKHKAINSTENSPSDLNKTPSKISLDMNLHETSTIYNGRNSEIASQGVNVKKEIIRKNSVKVDMLRREYIMMLIKNKIWVPGQKKSSFNSIVIFDWDDTLLCSSFLTPHGVFEEDIEISEQDMEQIAKLEFAVLRILTKCFEMNADVFIITNSEKGWVEYSANRFLPSVSKLLSKTTIISARHEYQKVFPNDTKRWKIEAYLSIREKFDDVSTNIINMGDSLFDLEAGGYLAKRFKESYLKSVKFRECPTIPELIKQLTLITNQFETVFKSIRNLTIRVEKK